MLRKLKARLEELKPKFKIRDAYLFGSWARGDFDGNSDIDILIVTNGDPSGMFMDETTLGMDIPCEVVFVTPETYSRGLEKGDGFYVAVNRDKVALL